MVRLNADPFALGVSAAVRGKGGRDGDELTRIERAPRGSPHVSLSRGPPKSDLDTTSAPIPTQSPEAFRATFAEYDALNAGLRETSKTALLAALSSTGITHVVVTFDGYGDSGQIERVEARRGDDTAELPETNISIIVAGWGIPHFVVCDLSIAEAVEQLAYDYLGDTRAG